MTHSLEALERVCEDDVCVSAPKRVAIVSRDNPEAV